MIGRYETEAMRRIWSQQAIFQRWTAVEVAAVEAWAERGEVPAEELAQVREKSTAPDPARVREIEKETNHDVVAFVRALGELVGEPASRHLHRGLTSSDVIDTALAMGLSDALDVVETETRRLQQAVGELAARHRATPCAGRTHGIHAEPTTFGLRVAGWYTELGRNIERLRAARERIAVGKLSGAVGNFSQTDPEFEAFVLAKVGLEAEPVATQVVPRDRHAEVLSALALLGAGIERFAVEVRALQRTDVGEAREPFGKGQTGSSAMPHKKNPIICERMTGMARLLRGYMVSAFENVALWHERDISHSSVERVSLPDAFHLAHYMLGKFRGVVEGLVVDADRMRTNLDLTRGMIFSQSVLGALLEKGMDRHEAYRLVQAAALRVWDGEAEDFQAALAATPEVAEKLPDGELDAAFDLNRYTRHVDALFERAGISG
jgi:adenylosuccinate lyase